MNKMKGNYYDTLMSLIEMIWDEWCDGGIERDDERAIIESVMEEYEKHVLVKRRKN